MKERILNINLSITSGSGVLPAILFLVMSSLPSSLIAQDFSIYDKFNEIELENEHRMFQEGGSLNFTINPDQIKGKTSTNVGGISISEISIQGVPYEWNGDFTMPEHAVDMIRDLRLPMTRIYALNDLRGRGFDLYGAIDRTHELAEKFGIPEENICLELNNMQKVLLTPGEWSRVIRYCKEKGYKFRYWETANEPHYSQHAFPTPDFYIEYTKAVYNAIKKEDPEAKIVAGILHTNINPEWHAYIMDKLEGHYDYVAPHSYNSGHDTLIPVTEPYEDIVLANNWLEMQTFKQIKAILDEYNPGSEIYETEWAMNWKLRERGPEQTADWQMINSGVAGSMHRLVRMMYYAQTEYMKGASSWTLFSYIPRRIGFGVVPRFDYSRTSMLYWTYYYFNRHLGPLMPEIQGECPYYTGKCIENQYPFIEKDLTKLSGPVVPVLATMNEEKSELYLVMVNGLSDKSMPCAFSVENSTPGEYEAVLLRPEEFDAYPVIKDKDEYVRSIEVRKKRNSFSLDIPAHSAVFLKINL